MSDKRAIIVKSCEDCFKKWHEDCALFKPLVKIPLPGESIPDSCSLPKWPSVTNNEALDTASIIFLVFDNMSKTNKQVQQRAAEILINWLESINVEVTNAKN